jgi:hypothetical protein
LVCVIQILIVVTAFVVWQWGWDLRSRLGGWVPEVAGLVETPFRFR